MLFAISQQGIPLRDVESKPAKPVAANPKGNEEREVRFFSSKRGQMARILAISLERRISTIRCMEEHAYLLFST